MTTRPALTFLAATLLLTGCALKATSGGGDYERLRADFRACSGEVLAFSFIPDGGETMDYHKMKCMKERGWIRDLASGFNDWAWAGDGSVKQLAKYRDGREAIVVVCPRVITCQPVVPTAEPVADGWTAWSFEVHAASQFRREDLVLVGDQEQCESVRQREAARGVPTTPACRGPLYYKRA